MSVYPSRGQQHRRTTHAETVALLSEGHSGPHSTDPEQTWLSMTWRKAHR